MNCDICTNAAVEKCYCAGIMCCNDCLENHKLALPKISHFSRKLSISEKPIISDLEISQLGKNSQNKELILSKIEEEIRFVNEATEDYKAKISSIIRNLESQLDIILRQVEEQKEETLEKLNSIVNKIEQIDLNEFNKFVEERMNFVDIDLKVPHLENVWDNVEVEIKYVGPSIGSAKLYHIKQDKLKVYDVSKRKLEVMTIKNMKSKAFSAIVGLPGSVLVSGGSTILGQAVKSVFEIDLNTQELIIRNNMIYERYYHSGIFVDNFVYVFGGMGIGEITSFERYNIITSSWEFMGDLHLSRKLPGVCHHGNKIFIAGGNKDFSIEMVSLDNFYVQSIQLQFPLSQHGCTLASIENGIIIFQNKNICLIGDDDTEQSLMPVEGTLNWWSQSPPVVQDKNIYILRFSDLCVFQFNYATPSLTEICKIESNNK
ncbi:unnamed protein product [Blepharisma stoltei]|uniref:B box-type domain-containing protein n=1 Tax=Blepharisma stoltei TaxID=1481888 RepID=A0AAU9JZT2_9CILI|nr:unnamed protein product [Blepharisma stoltei]